MIAEPISPKSRNSNPEMFAFEKDDWVEEEEIEDETTEEARMATKARDPSCPTEAERKAHEHNHLPFRIWCDECVRGRLDNPAHKAVPVTEKGVPEVAMDYAFMNRTGDVDSMKILITKDRDSRVIIAN